MRARTSFCESPLWNECRPMFFFVLVDKEAENLETRVSDYLREENRVLRAGLRGKRLRLSDDDRRRLADHVSQHIETLQRSLPTSLLLVPSLVRIGKRAKTQYRYSLSDSRQSSG